jgi:hypothetical protein
MDAQPVLINVGKASDTLPGMKEHMILHAGPPINWERMCGPMKGAVIGALIYEGKAENPDEAEKVVESGEVEFSPCHHHCAVGPMSGVISTSMPVFIVKNVSHENLAYSTINEGLGKVLRFGAYSSEVVERLKWIERVIAPALKAALKESTGINLKNIISQALHMGDECHNRNVAGTSLFLRELTPLLFKVDNKNEVVSKVFKFISGNNHFFLNLSMAACKGTMDAVHGIGESAIVTAMARNGTDFGIKVSCLGDKWFTSPAPKVKGLYLPGFSEQDANPDLGDSAICETAGIGGFAMAAAPAIVQFVGGTASDAVKYTMEMAEITVAKHRNFTIPSLNFDGSPTGIDVRKVVEKGVAPLINTGIAHRNPGVGQIGAGLVRAPMECFIDALNGLAKKLGLE